MKFNNKLLVLAKGISVWWGIYLILGCCAGFAVKTIQDLFLDVKPFKIMMFAPFMCVGSLLLAIFTYFITNLLKRAPMKRLRRKLVKIFKAEGFSQSYLDMLFANATGDNKNPMLIEAAAAYCIRGETETAAKTLAQADLTSILDVAQSTGDFRTAAYYYCVKMAACIVAKDGSGAAEAYDQGIYYLDAFSDSDMVMAVLALYQTEGGLGNSAIETAKKIKWHSLPRPMRKCGRSFSELIKARNLLVLERYDDAEAAARASMEGSCTEFMSSRAEEILKLADEKKLEADIAGAKESSEAEKDTGEEEAPTAEETLEAKDASVTEEAYDTETPAESSEVRTDKAEDPHDF